MSDIARYKSKAEWDAQDPILRDGEPGFEDDTGKVKIGTGFARWSDLSYANVPPYTLPREEFDFGGGGANPEELRADFMSVVNAGTDLSTARPADAVAVLWKFSAGTVVGVAGANVVNRQPGDLIFVADA